jgi:hypothetical protein
LLLEVLGPVLGVVALGFVAPRAPLHGSLSWADVRRDLT